MYFDNPNWMLQKEWKWCQGQLKINFASFNVFFFFLIFLGRKVYLSNFNAEELFLVVHFYF